MPTRGELFVFEGPDGVGKTTLAQRFTEELQARGVLAIYLAFPGRTEKTLGYHVYQLHHDPAKFGIESISPTSLQILHISSHIEAIEYTILPALAQGQTIVLDRFWWSTVAYGKSSGVPDRSIEAMIKLELEHWGSVKPTAAFLIQRPYPLRPERLEHWYKLLASYRELVEQEKANYPTAIINNVGLPEETLGEIHKFIHQRIHKENCSKKNGNPPLSSMNGSYPGQLALELSSTVPEPKALPAPSALLRFSPARPTSVFDTYWKFAAKRQDIFFHRFAGALPPWTTDPILKKHKFTNAYRASDRVSQYLIRHVIYKGEQTAEEIFFRILLFKFFNRIDTWEWLVDELGPITYRDYKFEHYEAALNQRMASGERVFSAAYIMPTGGGKSGFDKKHSLYLKLLETMMDDRVPDRITTLKSMRQVFELIRGYPLMGDFLAYQYTIDINYSTLTDFSEMEFVVPGPGARDGIRKCFSDLGGLNEVDIIRLVTEHQEAEFERLGIEFKTLWGRALQLIDCQNLFCEVDKYARIAHPEVPGITGRTKIKQIYQLVPERIDYWYPPKWGINHLIDLSKEKKGDVFV